MSQETDKKIWYFLINKGLNEYGTAGVMGNFYAESGLKSNNLQNSYEKKLGYTDETYTAAVDNGTYTDFVYDSAGYGLAQWTHWSRKKALLNFAKSEGVSIGDLNMQLNFFWKELNDNFRSLLNTLKTAKNIAEASNAMLTIYERPADQSEAAKQRRIKYSQNYYDEYAKKYIVEIGDFYTIEEAEAVKAALGVLGTESTVKIK